MQAEREADDGGQSKVNSILDRAGMWTAQEREATLMMDVIGLFTG